MTTIALQWWADCEPREATEAKLSTHRDRQTDMQTDKQTDGHLTWTQ